MKNPARNGGSPLLPSSLKNVFHPSPSMCPPSRSAAQRIGSQRGHHPPQYVARRREHHGEKEGGECRTVQTPNLPGSCSRRAYYLVMILLLRVGVLTCHHIFLPLPSSQSTVLAGIESQLLVFFKTSPDFIQLKEPVMLQYLLVLSYIALIFSVSATISSLVLTRNIPRLAGRLREKIRGTAKCGFDVPPFQTELSDASGIIPRRWRWIEWHCV